MHRIEELTRHPILFVPRWLNWRWDVCSTKEKTILGYSDSVSNTTLTAQISQSCIAYWWPWCSNGRRRPTGKVQFSPSDPWRSQYHAFGKAAMRNAVYQYRWRASLSQSNILQELVREGSEQSFCSPLTNFECKVCRNKLVLISAVNFVLFGMYFIENSQA